LADLGLSERPFLVCCPAGISILSIKCWPAAAFVRVLSEIMQATSLEVLLLAHESERAILDDVAGGLRTAGLPAHLHAGASGTMPLTAGLIQRSKVYFGNDTGNLHLAAALNVPVAAVFGGGTWPRFQPTAKRSVVIVNPLPCFGCGWNCHFGEALCLKVIRPEDVVQPVIRLINGPPSDPAVVTVQNVSENAFESIRASRSTYVRLQREGEKHLATVEEQNRFIAELARVLKPDGTLAISFDLGEPSLGITHPQDTGRALTTAEFERSVWFHPAFGSHEKPPWNLADIPAFKTWHRHSDPHHNYIVGAAILQKASLRIGGTMSSAGFSAARATRIDPAWETLHEGIAQIPLHPP
jgi:SAM-dependent methyltransferase